jgi:hypothetical protein
MKKKIITAILVIVLIAGTSLPIFANNLASDITGHWAEKEISNLLTEDILSTYVNSKFKPHQAITREEFATGLAKAMDLNVIGVTNLKDIQSHPAKGYIAALVRKDIITGYPDNTFRPEKEISRAEMVTMLARALELNKMETEIEIKKSYYGDINVNHWANNYVNLTSHLGIISGYPDGTFQANNQVTRAEAAKMIANFLNLKVVKGQLLEKYPVNEKIAVKTDDGERVNFNLAQKALLGRNKRLVNLKSLSRNDNLHLVLNQANEVKYLKAYGIITKDDLAVEVSEMSEGIFDPNEVKELSKGNTDVLKSKLKTEVSKMSGGILAPQEVETLSKGNLNIIEPKLRQGIKNELINQGATLAEAEAILDTNWDVLQESGRVRLTEAISLQTGVPLDAVRAIFEQNWTRLQRLAKIELIQRMTEQVMYSGLLS